MVPPDTPTVGGGLLPLFQRCLGACVGGGLYLEFGVSSGGSMRLLRQLLPPEQVIYGFDSWEGIPEHWNGHPAGTYRSDPPECGPNVVLVGGWFADTLPGFLARHRGHASFINVDCDLYSSTITVLRALGPRMVAGTVIRFDEFTGYRGCEEHEQRALREFTEETGRPFRFLARDGGPRVAVIME